MKSSLGAPCLTGAILVLVGIGAAVGKPSVEVFILAAVVVLAGIACIVRDMHKE